MEVLDGSGRLWRVNGTRLRQRFVLPRSWVAETPAFAGIAADWVQPVAPEEPGAPYLNDREMSEPEHAEIAGLIRGVLWENVPGVVLLHAWALWVSLGSLRDPQHPAALGLGLTAALWAVVIWRDIMWYRRFQVARAFSQDRRIGRVVITRMPIAEAGAHFAQPRLAPAEEYLPVSHAIWTIDGVPAPWRRGLSLRPRKSNRKI
jgi:hypothetical protein